jgi:hypothetical protein
MSFHLSLDGEAGKQILLLLQPGKRENNTNREMRSIIKYSGLMLNLGIGVCYILK